jgi:hypothetical protein
VRCSYLVAVEEDQINWRRGAPAASHGGSPQTSRVLIAGADQLWLVQVRIQVFTGWLAQVRLDQAPAWPKTSPTWRETSVKTAIHLLGGNLPGFAKLWV